MLEAGFIHEYILKPAGYSPVGISISSDDPTEWVLDWADGTPQATIDAARAFVDALDIPTMETKEQIAKDLATTDANVKRSVEDLYDAIKALGLDIDAHLPQEFIDNVTEKKNLRSQLNP
jgi:hypothetical protein